MMHVQRTGSEEVLHSNTCGCAVIIRVLCVCVCVCVCVCAVLRMYRPFAQHIHMHQGVNQHEGMFMYSV